MSASYVDTRDIQASCPGMLRIGQVKDGSVATGQSGQPSQPVVQFCPPALAAADTVWFLDEVTTGTADKTYTLETNLPPDSVVDQFGRTHYISRNLSAVLSGAKTVDLTIVGEDTQGIACGEVLPLNGTTPVYSKNCYSRIISLSTNGTATARDLSVGYGNEIGLPYPFYSNNGLCNVLYDEDGADYPNTPMTIGGALPGTPTMVGNVVSLTDLRVWNAMDTPLPGTAATDDLGLVMLGTTVGTDWDVAVQTADMDNNDAVVPYYAGFLFTMPPTYIAGGDVEIVGNAGMVTTVADVSCTLDFQVFKSGAPTTDLCATAAQSMNSLTAADLEFTITATGLSAGDRLVCRVGIAGRDNGALGGVTIGRCNSITVNSLQSASASVASAGAYTFTAGDPTVADAERYGKVLLGTDNTDSGDLVPDGTRTYAIWYIGNDAEGTKGSDGQFHYQTN